jgi:hypothetical protein
MLSDRMPFVFNHAADSDEGELRRLMFEISGRRRQDARPGLAKMYRVPPDRAWWPAVGAPLERGVRPHRAYCDPVADFLAAPWELAGKGQLSMCIPRKPV